MNKGRLILYNRFVVDRGPGLFAKTASFEHIIKGNVFVLRDKQPNRSGFARRNELIRKAL